MSYHLWLVRLVLVELFGVNKRGETTTVVTTILLSNKISEIRNMSNTLGDKKKLLCDSKSVSVSHTNK